jgi:hypothetical protein
MASKRRFCTNGGQTRFYTLNPGIVQQEAVGLLSALRPLFRKAAVGLGITCDSGDSRTFWQTAEKACGPWFDRLTMRCNLLILQRLILSLSKDEANIMSFSAPC